MLIGHPYFGAIANPVYNTIQDEVWPPIIGFRQVDHYDYGKVDLHIQLPLLQMKEVFLKDIQFQLKYNIMLGRVTKEGIICL